MPDPVLPGVNPAIDSKFMSAAKANAAVVAPSIDPVSIITLIGTILQGIISACSGTPSPTLASNLQNPNMIMQASLRHRARKYALQHGMDASVGDAASAVTLKTGRESSTEDLTALFDHAKASQAPDFDMM